MNSLVKKKFNISSVFVAGTVSLLLLASAPANSALTPVSDSNSVEANLFQNVTSGKSDPSLNLSIMDRLYGAGNYTRINDSVDQLWTSTGGPIIAVAKFAANTESVGYFAGTSGPTNAATFTSLLTVVGSNYAISGTGNLPVMGSFRFGLQTSPSQSTPYMSSLVTDNADGLDHMVTFEITGNSGGFNNDIGDYVIAFEDLLAPVSDRDFNDVVLQVGGVSILTPEPVTYAILGGALSIAYAVKRRRSSQMIAY